MSSIPRGVQISLVGFLFALIGAAAGFIGFGSDTQWLSIGGFIIVVFGVVVGFIGILYGWAKVAND